MPLQPPYRTILKPYGQALVRYAAEHPEVICLGADLTRQTETDLFRDDPGSRPASSTAAWRSRT